MVEETELKIVYKDKHGLYIKDNNNIARPVYKSIYAEGNSVATQSFLNGKKFGVGKDRTCRNGEFIELWVTE